MNKVLNCIIKVEQKKSYSKKLAGIEHGSRNQQTLVHANELKTIIKTGRLSLVINAPDNPHIFNYNIDKLVIFFLSQNF